MMAAAGRPWHQDGGGNCDDGDSGSVCVRNLLSAICSSKIPTVQGLGRRGGGGRGGYVDHYSRPFLSYRRNPKNNEWYLYYKHILTT